MIKVGITGGIGSGKSTVCRLFAVLGVPVYDSDAQARRLMNEDRELGQRVILLLGEKAYEDGQLNRAYVGSRVFAEQSLLTRLNGVVHPAVGQDFLAWSDTQTQTQAHYVILESAILFESGFDKYVDRTITISAPQQERLKRTMQRDGADIDSIRARMVNQMSDEQREVLADYVICNKEEVMITEQVLRLNEAFIKMKL